MDVEGSGRTISAAHLLSVGLLELLPAPVGLRWSPLSAAGPGENRQCPQQHAELQTLSEAPSQTRPEPEQCQGQKHSTVYNR